MGGGSHNPDSDIDDRPSVPKGSVSGAKSSHGRQGHGNMDRDLGDAYSHMGSVGGHRGHGPGRNSYRDDMHHSTRSVPGVAQGERGLGSRGMADQMHDMSLKDTDRHHEMDLATLRNKRAELKAYLGFFSDMTAEETTREDANAVVELMEIERDIIELESGERPDGKPRHGTRERMDSIDFDRSQGRAGGRVQQSTPGRQRSEPSKPRNIRTEERHPGGSGHGSRRPVAEADIASITRDMSRLGTEIRERAQMPRGMGPSSHYHDVADYAGEESDYRPRGSRRGHHHPSRYPNDAMVPPSHDDNQYYDAEMSEYQRGSRHGPHLRPAGQSGHSGCQTRHFPGR